MDDELKMTEDQTEVKKASGQIQEKWWARKQIVKLTKKKVQKYVKSIQGREKTYIRYINRIKLG